MSSPGDDDRDRDNDARRADLVDRVRRAQGGDRAAIVSLVEEFQPQVMRFCIYLSGHRPLAQDLCQDSLIKALQSLPSLHEPARFSGWLLKIAKNLYLDHLKLAKNTEHARLTDDEGGGLETLLEGESRDLDQVLQIQAALSKLPSDDRALLLLVDMQGYSYAEAAQIVGMNEKSVASRLHRIREAFMRNYK